ncbi:acyl-CoA-like ligand-binding transcription factor [Streptomyces microflavus]|uniref:acyl-CoA-like ligand-binding transcription factor n=1 Tax=Streptomyces microflavus TaxID=1919 RepID=UPI0036510CC8
MQREAHRSLTHGGARAVDEQQLAPLDAEVVERAPRRLGCHRQRGGLLGGDAVGDECPGWHQRVFGGAGRRAVEREFLLRRGRVIATNPALAERDLIKLADIADALAPSLERRGVEPGKARFIIDVVLAIHRRAMPRWLAEPDTTLAQLMAQAAAELRETVALPAPTAR